MENERKKAKLIIIGMSVLFVISTIMVFVMKKWYFKLLFVIPAVALGVILGRMYLAYKRKKIVFTGKVLTITKPNKKLVPKWTVIMKDGKISKKLYSLEEPKMRVGEMYSVAYEDKSNTILMVEKVDFQIARKMVSGKNMNNINGMKFR